MAAADATPVTDVAQEPPFLVKLLVPTAKAPTRGSAFAAGYDMYAAAPITVPARGKALVSTGLAVAVPVGTCEQLFPSDILRELGLTGIGKTDGRVAPRSGLASKNHIDTGAGVIDADYRGEVKVLLFNHAETDFEVEEGMRVAQLILERVSAL